jgi:putative SOS response-associated peptidase YedK
VIISCISLLNRSTLDEGLLFAAFETLSQSGAAGPATRSAPVILPPETWPAWLGEEPAEPAELQAMLAPYPAELMRCWPDRDDLT